VHQFGFDFADPFFEVGDYRLALQVITFENTYALDPRQTRRVEEGEGWGLESVGLCAAGGQQRHPGRAWLRASRTVDGLEIVAGAEHAEKIRCLKLILRDLAPGELVGRRWQSVPVPPEARHWWPTVTLIDGTLDRAAEKVERVIQQARDYARRYLA
jgi:hypothetical protein